MQFSFIPSRTKDNIFVLRKLPLYFPFTDLDKAFDQVFVDVVWWALRRLGVEEWLVRCLQSMYRKSWCRGRVNGSFGDAFLAHIGLQKERSVLRPLVFVIALEAFFREVRSGCSKGLLYADDLALVTETLESLKGKLEG